MKFGRTAFALVLLHGMAVAADAPREIADRYARNWTAAHDKGDADALTALYARDAILLPPGVHDPIVGEADIKAFFQILLRDPARDLSIESVSVTLSDNLIYSAGRWSERVHGRPVHGLFLFILTRHDDGWKAQADTWNIE